MKSTEEKPSQAEVVRQFLRANPSKTQVSTIMSELEAAGTPVTKSVASNVLYAQKSQWQKKRRSKKDNIPHVESPRTNLKRYFPGKTPVANGDLNITDLVVTMKTIKRLGGAEAAMTVLKELESAIR